MTTKEKRAILSKNAKAILNWVENNVPCDMNANIKFNIGFIYHHNSDYIMIRIKNGKADIITHHTSGRGLGISSDGTITEYDDYYNGPDKDVTDTWLTNFAWYKLAHFQEALEYIIENWQGIKQQVMREIEKEKNLINFTV